MTHAVLDPNVLVSAAISTGAPAQLLAACGEGRFDLIASPLLLAELSRVLRRPRIAERVGPDADALVASIHKLGVVRPDPATAPPVRSRDPDDDYLIALAADADAVLVTGDRGLLDLADRIPVRSPAAFLAELP